MSIRNHRKQKTTQILIPFFLLFLLTAIAASFFFRGISAGSLDQRAWGDIAAIIIIIPVLIYFKITLIFLLLFIFLIQKSHSTLMTKLPSWSTWIQSVMKIINRIAETIVKPFVWFESIAAVFNFLSSDNLPDQENNGKKENRL